MAECGVVMRCSERGVEADDQALGWRALTGEEDDGELMMVVVACDGSKPAPRFLRRGRAEFRGV